MLSLNGAEIYEFSLFGIPPSTVTEAPKLDRSVSSPLDLSAANRNWIHEYQNIDTELFHFGGGSLSYSENIGYFMNNSGTIYSIRTSGEILNEWSDFQKFLEEEISRASIDYPEYEKFMEELLSKHRKKNKWWKFWA